MKRMHYTLAGMLSIVVVPAAISFAQDSRIELHSLYSATLNVQENYNIFLPEGYDQQDERYPVVYLFRGNEREWANPSEDGSRRGNIKTVADALSGSGRIGKMILVMPGLSAPATDDEYTYLLTELVPYIDGHYRTLPTRWQRGMDGFSLGGLSVLTLLWEKPETFCTAGAYDGSYFLFDIQALANAPESYWAQVRPVKILFHGAVIGGNNYEVSQQVLSIFAAHGITNGFAELALAPTAQHNWFYADLHMEQSLPLHWQQFQDAPHNVAVNLGSPATGSKISGNVNVSWSVGSHGEHVQAFLEYSSDRGGAWHQLCSSSAADSTYLWNTTLTTDGTRYLLRMRAFGDTLYGIAQSQDRFTIDNPGNGLPDVELLAPQANEVVSGSKPITWWAEDAEGDPLSLSIETSENNGITWELLVSGLQNSGSYVWDSRQSSNSSACRLRLRCSDGKGASEAVSAPFTVANQRAYLADSLLHHVAGASDGRITIHASDPTRITGHKYRITFDGEFPGRKTYSVRDVDLNTTVADRVPIVGGSPEGPQFDGLRLVVTDIDTPEVSTDSTRWIAGSSTLMPRVLLPQIDPGGGVITGKPSASDYLITLFDHIVDTSSSYFYWSEIPVKFTVRNITHNRQVDILFTDIDNNNTISRFDDLIILEPDSNGQPFPSWELFFTGSDNAVPPFPGDSFRLRILKPFATSDIYEFTALPSGIVAVRESRLPEDFTLFQNYPNPFNPTTNIGFGISDRGLVSLKVYDILGREVATLVSEVKQPGTYTVHWDAAGMASGIYFYRLESGKFVSVRKMLLLR